MDARAICLAVLSLGDASGYEIRKSLESGPFGSFTDAGFGSIYPALKRLSDEGMVAGRQESQGGRPDKTVYSVTQKGKLALLDVLSEGPSVERLHSDHLFRLYFAHLLPARAVEALIEDRIAFYTAKMAHMQDKRACDPANPGADFVCGFGLALYEAGARYLEEHKHELLAAIAIDGELATPGDAAPGTSRLHNQAAE
jgi:PadR family transcriptional regulator AphA